ncbi:MAG: DUF3109 family protein [Prolixibacteraceae bacterium]|jgi:hypothetical protein|nr:DUF3109 family protein [Prolixibacteraceae bacterium]
MIQIDKAIVSFDVFKKQFLCNIMACKGACCVEGDSGAPLTKDEAEIIENNYPVFKKYLDRKYQLEVEKQGRYVVDSDGDIVTPLFNNRECVYTFKDENNITKCAIEKAYLNGEIDFHKPVSCHLFPIRITEYKEFDAVNYQKLYICKPGRECGVKNELPLYVFLKEPLIRKYGESWYEELEIAAAELNKNYFKD